MSVVTKYLFMTVFIITLSGCSTTKYNVSVPDNLDPKFEKIVAERVKEVEKVKAEVARPPEVKSTPKQTPVSSQTRKMNPKVLIEQQRATAAPDPQPEPEGITETVTESEVVTKEPVALKSKYNTIFLISVIQSIVVLVLGFYLLRKNKL